MKILLMVLLGSSLAVARPFQVTASGTLLSQDGSTVVVQAEDGSRWTGQLLGPARRTLRPGRRLVFRIQGGLGEVPRRIDLVDDWSRSSTYAQKGIPTPEFVRQGTWAGVGGVGGFSPNSPQLGQHRNVGAYAANGGMPHQNMDRP